MFWFLVFGLLVFQLFPQRRNEGNEEHAFDLLGAQTCRTQRLSDHSLLCFVPFTWYELFSDRVALCPQASAIGTASLVGWLSHTVPSVQIIPPHHTTGD